MITVENTGKGLVSIRLALDSVVQLKPGVNRVDAAAWSACEKHENVQRMLHGDIQALRVLSRDGDANPFENKNVKDACELVAKTFDEDLLGAWRNCGEKRTTVLNAIDKQILSLQDDGKNASKKVSN